MADENTQTGKIDWKRYDPGDEKTQPSLCTELVILALKDGKPVYIPRGYFGLADDRFYEVKSARKRIEHPIKDYEDIAWVYLDVPSWWRPGRKKENENASK